MPRLSLLPTIAREIIISKHQKRIPEPMVMDEQEQVDAFAEAGRINGIMSASYLFQSARISQVIQECSHVIDLGCGPATQLAQVAELNPNIQFTGIDLSEEMLESGRTYLADRGVSNVDLKYGDITKLTNISDKSVDGFMSTMVLHQLPDFSMLASTFSEIERCLRPEGAVYLVDFGRLKSPKSCKFFSHLNAAHQPQAFTEDYQASLHAAYLFEEYQQLTSKLMPVYIQVYGSFMVPMLTIIKSPDQPIPDALRKRLIKMRKELPKSYRNELDDIRLFMYFGGMKNDPFKN